MDTQTLFHACLVLHIIGFAALTGSILADFVINRRMANYMFNDRPKALAILDSISILPRIIILGALTLIITGPIMVLMSHGVIQEMLWFKIKMPLVILIILNARIIGRPAGLKLRKLVNENDNNQQLAKVMSRIRVFELSQLTIIFIIIILSAFQFN